MRIIFYVLMFCFALQTAQAQSSPTIVGGKPVNSNNYDEIVAQLDAFWKDNPNRKKKGSGFKPYQRWKELWKHLHHDDGTLLTQAEVQALYLEGRKLHSNAKSQNNSTNDISNWIPLGPFSHTNSGSWSSGQGRVNVTLVDPNNPNTIYIGTPNGGLWKSTNHGTTWNNMTDFLPTIGVSGIAVDYANSNIVYISTGDEDASDSYSSGIFKSLDGGVTWSPTGFPIGDYSLTGEIYIHPTNSNILWVVSSQGFYKSINGGQTWSMKNAGICKEMRLKPNNPDVIYLVENNYNTSQVYLKKSVNGGDTFTTIETYNNAGRTAIAVTPANAEYLYVLVSNNDDTFQGLFRSTNSGASFTLRNNETNIYESQQAWFDLALTVSDEYEDLIYTGCLNVWASADGGQSFYQVNEWFSPEAPSYTHADIHDLKFFNGKLYAGTDGGIYISEDYGSSFVDKTKNGVAIGQFYRIDVKQASGTNIVGGLQDNGGYQYYENQWYNYHGADGMDAAIHPTENYSGSFIQFGLGLYATSNDQTPSGNYVVGSPNELYGNWITPLEFGANGKLYAGFDMLYSLNMTNYQWEAAIDFPFTNQNIDQIKVDPSNDNRVLFSSENRLFLSNGNFPLVFDELFLPGFGDITNFAFNHQNPQIIYVTRNTQVFKSVDSGVNWSDITFNLPSSRKIDIIHQSGSANNTIYVALAKAVYVLDDSSNSWQLHSNGLPNTTITDIEINTVENHVIVSTYGRGIWRSAVATSSLGNANFANNAATIYFYPNPSTEGFVKLNSIVAEPVNVRVYDANGKKVLEKPYNEITLDTQISLSKLTKGTYFIQLISDHHLITKQIVVQ